MNEHNQQYWKELGETLTDALSNYQEGNVEGVKNALEELELIGLNLKDYFEEAA